MKLVIDFNLGGGQAHSSEKKTKFSATGNLSSCQRYLIYYTAGPEPKQGKRSSHKPPKHGIKLSNRTTHTHKSNCQIASPAHPQICHLCVLDHYNSTHTIIRVAVKKRHQLIPRFWTSVCWTPIAAFKPSLE